MPVSHHVRAVALLLVSAAMVPFVATADVNQARQLLSQGHLDQALTSVDETLKQAPDDVEARLLKGVILAQSGEMDGAVALFQSLIEERPDLPQPYNNLAAIHASRGEFGHARDTLLNAIERNPAYPVARENLGDLYANMAQLEYQRALMLQEENARIRLKAEKISGITGRPFRMPSARELPAQVSNSQSPQAGSSPSSPPDTPAPSCLLVGPFSKKDHSIGAATWMRRRGAAVNTIDRETPIIRFMVYLPVAGEDSAGTALLARLGKAGIKDMSAARIRNGQKVVSLGIFSQQASVNRRLTELRGKGFNPQVEERSRSRKLPWIRADFGADRPAMGEIRTAISTPGMRIEACP